jgi:hypothetical protein
MSRTLSLTTWGRITAIAVGVSFATALAQTTQTKTATQSIACAGDCDGDGSVTVDEILRLVNIALGSIAVGECPAGDVDGNGDITVDEILTAVSSALAGCRPMGLDLTGHWAGRETVDGFEVYITFDLVQTGDRISGSFSIPSEFEQGTVTATLAGNQLTGLALSTSDPFCPANYSGTGTVNGDEISFSFTGSDCEDFYRGTGTVTRVRFCQGGEANCCGNGVVDGSEECDINSFGPTCQDLGFEGGQTFCTDCILDQSNCFSGGTCSVGGECDDSCLTVCPDSFVRFCVDDVCVRGSCVCLDDISSIEECCEGGL